MKIMNVVGGALTLILGTVLVAGCGDSKSNTSSSSAVQVSAPATLDGTEADSAALDPEGKGGTVSLRKNFYFVFDGSGSMKDKPKAEGGDQHFTSKIQGAKWAVNEFLKKVPKDVNLGLFVFDQSGTREVLPLGPSNREQFLKKVNAISAHGATPLGAGISKGTDSLRRQYSKQLGYGEYRLIVITDGESTDSLGSGVSKAAKFKIPIYTIGFDMGSEHALRKHSVSYRAADSAKQLEQALEQAVGELDIYDPADFSASAR